MLLLTWCRLNISDCFTCNTHFTILTQILICTIYNTLCDSNVVVHRFIRFKLPRSPLSNWPLTTVVLPIWFIETCMHIISLYRSITKLTWYPNYISRETEKASLNNMLPGFVSRHWRSKFKFMNILGKLPQPCEKSYVTNTHYAHSKILNSSTWSGFCYLCSL